MQKYEELFNLYQNKPEKNSSNSCKLSSTDGFKKQVQNNRVKSGRKAGREIGDKRSAPHVSSNPTETKIIEKVKTCTCGCKTEDVKEVKRDLISIEIKVHKII